MSWSPPLDEHHNGVIKSYNVYVASINTDEEFVRSVNSLQIVVPNLRPFYSYEFSVAAVTISEGPFSEPVVIKMPEAGVSL